MGKFYNPFYIHRKIQNCFYPNAEFKLEHLSPFVSRNARQKKKIYIYVYIMHLFFPLYSEKENAQIQVQLFQRRIKQCLELRINKQSNTIFQFRSNTIIFIYIVLSLKQSFQGHYDFFFFLHTHCNNRKKKCRRKITIY